MEETPQTQHLRLLGARSEVCDAHERVMTAEGDDATIEAFRQFLKVVGPVPKLKERSRYDRNKL